MEGNPSPRSPEVWIQAEPHDVASSYEQELGAVWEELYLLRGENLRLFGPQLLQDQVQCKFLIGRPNISVYDVLFDHATIGMNLQSVKQKLNPREELFLTLVKLKLNLLNKDLAQVWNIRHNVCRTFHKWLQTLYVKLKPVIIWPEREDIRRTMSKAFVEFNPKVRCIIDCTEFFIERPTAFRAQAATWSITINTIIRWSASLACALKVS